MTMTIEERLSLLAVQAANLVEDGMRIGLGSGSTFEAVVKAIGNRVNRGLRVSAVATSTRTADLATACGIPLVDLNDVERLDIGIDGADEIDPELNLVKGRGGALLREKVVARSCDRFVVVSSSEKLVDRLGVRMPLPVEIVPFGWRHTARRIEALGCTPALRQRADGTGPFVTDEGNLIVDCATGPIFEPASFDLALKAITGVVDHGIFLAIADQALIVDPMGSITAMEPASVAST
jgi:ribose 5-phosphate isomerase A